MLAIVEVPGTADVDAFRSGRRLGTDGDRGLRSKDTSRAVSPRVNVEAAEPGTDSTAQVRPMERSGFELGQRWGTGPLFQRHRHHVEHVGPGQTHISGRYQHRKTVADN